MERWIKAMAALIAAGLALVLAATALAAHPKPGKRYAGTITNVEKIEGFSAPVSFKVSAPATQLLNFSYGTTGCFGSGGFWPGVNPYTASDAITVGAITVARSGSFSISNSKSTYHSTKYGFSYITTSQVTGKFTTSNSATGTISFSQKYVLKTGKGSSCTATLSPAFKATLK
jgi:hypothetical protein